MTKATVLLVDLSSIGHPIWHMSQSEPDPDYTSQRIVSEVLKLASDHPHAAICCDAPGASFRKELDPTYKANRPKQQAPLYHQINLAKDRLESEGFTIFEVNGFEADDLIATATAKLTCSPIKDPVPVLIASADKDLLALIGEHVEVHSTRTGDRIGPDEVKAKIGIEPCQVVDYLTLVGDASDNIKGAKGIGPKTAVGMLNIFGNIDDLYTAIDAGEAALKPAQRASLEELRPRLATVRSLVTMRADVPMDVAEVFEERVPKAAETFMEGELMDDIPLVGSLPDTGISDAEPGVTAKEVNAKLRDHERKFGPPSQPPPPQPTDLAPIAEPAPSEWERGLEPRSMDDAVRLAQRMHDSRMFSAYGTPQAVLSTMLLGRELGMPSMASLRSVHVIEGKHSLSADLMVALVLKSGLAEYFWMVESTDTICTFETERKGNPKPTRLSYTIEQAKQAGLLGPTRSGKPSNWQKIPMQMLRARAKSELARLEYPDLLAGLYTPEELRDAKMDGGQ